jgi:hypothetical protein
MRISAVAFPPCWAGPRVPPRPDRRRSRPLPVPPVVSVGWTFATFTILAAPSIRPRCGCHTLPIRPADAWRDCRVCGRPSPPPAGRSTMLTCEKRRADPRGGHEPGDAGCCRYRPGLVVVRSGTSTATLLTRSMGLMSARPSRDWAPGVAVAAVHAVDAEPLLPGCVPVPDRRAAARRGPPRRRCGPRPRRWDSQTRFRHVACEYSLIKPPRIGRTKVSCWARRSPRYCPNRTICCNAGSILDRNREGIRDVQSETRGSEPGRQLGFVAFPVSLASPARRRTSNVTCAVRGTLR